MSRRIISYKEEDFKGAKMLVMKKGSKIFNAESKFGVYEITNVTPSNVMFDNRNELTLRRKGISFFGVVENYDSYFLVRKDQTEAEAIEEVVKAYEIYYSELTAELAKEMNNINKAQRDFLQ